MPSKKLNLNYWLFWIRKLFSDRFCSLPLPLCLSTWPQLFYIFFAASIKTKSKSDSDWQTKLRHCKFDKFLSRGRSGSKKGSKLFSLSPREWEGKLKSINLLQFIIISKACRHESKELLIDFSGCITQSFKYIPMMNEQAFALI